MSGASADDKTSATIGWALTEFDQPLQPGTRAWREAARRRAGVQLEVLTRVSENDKGAPQQKLQHSLLRPAEPGDEKPDPVSLLRLLDSYLAELAKSGKGAEVGKRWKPIFKTFVALLGFDDASRLRSSRYDIRRRRKR